MALEKALNADDVRELGWVADVIEVYANGSQLPTREDALALAGVIRSKLPKQKVVLSSDWTVYDRNGAEYKNFDGVWYLVADGKALAVPYESILEPTPLALEVV